MKKHWMKNVALFLLLGMALPSFAQQPEGQERRERREIPSPENNARRITKEFKQAFKLTDEGYEKVYELYLKQEKDILPSQNGNGNMPPRRGGMGGPGGGGPGGGFGGPGGGMGGPQMGGGMPPQGGRPDMQGGNMPEDMKAKMEEMRKEQQTKREKAAKKLSKKMKKILDKDQFAQWQEWENKRNTQPQPPQGPRPERDHTHEGTQQH